MILSPDHFLYHADGTYDWTPSRVSSAWRMTLEGVARLLQDPRITSLTLLMGLPGAGKSTWLRHHEVSGVLYVDATFMTRESRLPFLREALAAGKPCDVVFLNTDLEVCQERNASRSSDRAVPREKMIQFALALESPTMDEGFRSISS